MKSAFRKISRVGSLTCRTKWYLSVDCLLAAKRTMYVVEYRRFYLRDLEHVMVWPSGLWLWRVIIPGVLFAALGASLWLLANPIAGEIFTGIGVAWVGLELVLGPTARSRIRTTGATVDLPLVKRTRRAQKVLARIDQAVRAARGVVEQPATPAGVTLPAEFPAQPGSAAPDASSIATVTQTNGS